MSDATMAINTAEFIAALRTIPTELTNESGGIVNRHALAIEHKVSAAYARVAKTGNLQRGLKVNSRVSGYSAVAVVRSTAHHNYLYENGTQGKIRYYKGASRGPMPAAHVFIPTAIRERRAMTDDLIQIVERAGFKVSHG